MKRILDVLVEQNLTKEKRKVEIGEQIETLKLLETREIEIQTKLAAARARRLCEDRAKFLKEQGPSYIEFDFKPKQEFLETVLADLLSYSEALEEEILFKERDTDCLMNKISVLKRDIVII